MKTLIVDDDRAVLALTGIILNRLGHMVLKARDSDEALALFQIHKPLGMVVLDVRLEGMDGFKLGAVMRINQPKLKILFISGSISDASPFLLESKIPPSGFFLHKPFLPRELSEMVHIMLRPEKNLRAAA